MRNFPALGKKYYSYKDRDEMRRKNIYFSCQEPWILGHKRVKGKPHYIDLFSKSDKEMEEEDEMVVLEFELHLDLWVESSDYVASIEWRMKIQIQQDKPHRKWTSIA